MTEVVHSLTKLVDRKLARVVPAGEPIHSIGLAMFRISFALVLLAEVAQMFRFRHLIFDPIPFVDPIRISVGGILFVWAVALVLLAFGFKTTFAAIANYAFAVMILGFSVARGGYTYHADSFYLVGSLMLMFLPSARVLSVDSLSETGRSPCVSKVHVLALKVVLATVYLDSFTWKIASPMWRSGLGVWAPAAHLFSTYRDISTILSSEVLVRTLGYAVVAFEGIFPLLIWFRRFEVPLIIAGALLHVGILLLFPIPLFSLVVISFYVGITPPAFFLSALEKPGLGFRDEPETSANTAVAVRLFVVFWILTSLLMMLQSPLLRIPAFWSNRPSRFAQQYYRLNNVLYYFAGVQPHGVFDDSFFVDYKRQTMLVFHRKGEERALPYTSKSGLAGGYLSGRVYCMWTWFSLDPRRDRSFVGRELIRYVTFWAVRESIDLNESFVSILQRPIDISLTSWRPNWSERNRSRSWIEVGRISGIPGNLQVEWISPANTATQVPQERPHS